MSEKYVERVKPDLERDLGIVNQVYEGMKNAGLKEFTLTKIDFNFTSDSKKDLEVLSSVLSKQFSFKTYYLKQIKMLPFEFELSIEIDDMIVTEKLLVYLIVDLFETAVRSGCVLGDWGASVGDTQFNFSTLVDSEEISKGYSFHQDGKIFMAFRSFYLVSEHSNVPEANFNLGCLKYDFGFVNDAISSFSKAIEADPTNPLPYLNRGVAYYDKKMFHESIADYTKLTSLTPENADPYINLGNSFVMIGDRDNAVRNYDHAVSLGSASAVDAKAKGLAFLERSGTN